MTASDSMKVGGLVLCGGKSTRMGQPKLMLPFGEELMLQRVVRILSQVVSPVVVVASRDQDLPQLPVEVQIAYDEVTHLGPLGGMVTGFKKLVNQADAAYVTGCDTPFLKPEFIQRMISSLSDYELAVPKEGEYVHPLAAVYRVQLLDKIEQLLKAKRMRPFFLIEESKAYTVDVSQLRTVDPDLQSLQNINDELAYHKALKQGGFSDC